VGDIIGSKLLTAREADGGARSPRIVDPAHPDPLGDPADPGNPTLRPAVAAVTELRRLTRVELDNTLSRIALDTNHRALEFMPGEELKPFDNAYEEQQASAVWVEAAERVANAVTADVMADPARRAALMPCTNTGNDDTACLASFARSFGLRALRRPLSEAEVTELMNLTTLARQRGDFWTSVSVVMRRLLLDPELLYRVEVGAQVPGASGLYQLDPYEVGSRLSFLIQGASPSDWLLASATDGGLSTAEQRRAAASRLLEEPEGRARIEAFHAMWLGYTSLPHSQALNAAMVAETSALVRKVVFEDRSDYRTLFTATSTYLDATLAQHYGLAAPATGSAWVSYGASGRKGILSHGAILSNGVKQTDTSPTLRGKWIRNRLFCQELPAPPPNVVADVPPAGTNGVVCKVDRYRVHDSVTSCAACHNQMDPIGFGLEQFDRAGRFRAVEEAHPECAISGDGAITGFGNFNGPAGLADLMIQTGSVESCVVKQLFRYTTGRHELTDDVPVIEALTKSFNDGGRKFDELVLDLVAHPTFAQRREAP
jgi:hypothetical protein